MGLKQYIPLYCLLWAKVFCRFRNSSSVTFTQYGTVGLQPQMKCAAEVGSTEEGPGTVALPASSVICWYPGGLCPSSLFSSKRKLCWWRVTDCLSVPTLTRRYWTLVCSCLQDDLMIWQHPDHVTKCYVVSSVLLQQSHGHESTGPLQSISQRFYDVTNFAFLKKKQGMLCCICFDSVTDLFGPFEGFSFSLVLSSICFSPTDFQI